ncbi:MAG: RES family NAD+ phosphorylase [Woeseia sp.]
MPRRPRSKGIRPKRPRRVVPKAGVELEKFTGGDLRTWQRQAEKLERFHVQLFFHLEGLRAVHHDSLCTALCSSTAADITLKSWVRIIDYEFSLEPLSAAGSLVHGGRFNIGRDLDATKYPAFPALYLAENYETAYEERFGQRPSRHAPLAGHEFALRTPESFTAINVDGKVVNLFDLRDTKSLKVFTDVITSFDVPKELRELAVSVGIKKPLLVRNAGALKKTLLAKEWRQYPSQYEIPANPQVFGRLAVDAGFDGIIYPSTKGPNACIALFPTNFAKSDSFVEIADAPPVGVRKTRLDCTTWRSIAAPPA